MVIADLNFMYMIDVLNMSTRTLFDHHPCGDPLLTIALASGMMRHTVVWYWYCYLVYFVVSYFALLMESSC